MKVYLLDWLFGGSFRAVSPRWRLALGLLKVGGVVVAILGAEVVGNGVAALS